MTEPTRTARTTLRGRVVLWFSLIFIALLLLVASLVRGGVEDLLIDQLTDDLVEEAQAVTVMIQSETDAVDVVDIGQALGTRITVIELDGTVVTDSVSDPAAMDDHSDRPEVIAAMNGEIGVSRRFSETTDEARLYVALPPEDGRIVRVSVTEAKVAAELDDLSRRIVSTVAIVGALGLVGVAVATARIVRPIGELTDIADRVSEGDLDVRARRSSVAELDRLGLAIDRMAGDLGRRLRETEADRETMQVVLGALPQGVLLVEGDGSISFSNPAAVTVLGEVPGQLRSLVPATLQRMVRQAQTGSGSVVAQLEHGSPARSLRTIVIPFGSDDRVLILVSDDTERQRVEAMRRDFVADASHELKTPVAAILASMEALQMAIERGSDRAAGFADQIEHSARRLAQIVEDLLDLSRLESSERTDADIALGVLVEEEVRRLRPTADDAGVSLEVDTQPIVMRGSPADLALAVRNLCENALRYTDQDGHVTVRVIDSGPNVEIEVEDTGVGIPRRALGRVFERFYRVDVARSRETGGTGLGLAIVKHIAERHGGSVSVTSQLGVGSTFRVTLPKHRDTESGDAPVVVVPGD